MGLKKEVFLKTEMIIQNFVDCTNHRKQKICFVTIRFFNEDER